jgi:hypothetical protein
LTVRALTAAEFARLRGFNYFMAAQGPAHDRWAEMRDMGAGVVRCWYSPTWNGRGYYVSPAQRRHMMEAIDKASAVGLVTVICVGLTVPDQPFLPGRAEAFVRMWRSLQRTHRHQPASVFDLLNEPMPPEGFAHVTHHSGEQCERIGRMWRDLSMMVLGALFADAPSRLCVVEMGLGADPNQFVQQKPLPLPNVVHSAHFYYPHSFTHHGVHEAVHGQPLPAPVALDNSALTAMDAGLDALAAWSKEHGLPVYIGEFSAHNYLPDATEYVRRCVNHFNERGWPWTYHDWRGWPGWNPTAGTTQVLSAALAGHQVAPPPPGESTDPPPLPVD